MWVLIVTILAWNSAGKLTAAQDVYPQDSEKACAERMYTVEKIVKETNPTDKAVMECVKVDKLANA